MRGCCCVSVLCLLLPSLRIKQQNMDLVLFFKIGKFYELFDEDAETGVRELSADNNTAQLTGTRKGGNGKILQPQSSLCSLCFPLTSHLSLLLLLCCVLLVRSEASPTW